MDHSLHFIVVPHTQGTQAWITVYMNACLYLVSVHQMAPPQTEVVDIYDDHGHLIAAYYSPERIKG